MKTKAELLAEGADVARRFCAVNNFAMPEIKEHARVDWPFDVCAYYRPTTINICLEKCAPIGTAGRQWSYPGYTVDRTPYGVIQHELGHHVDRLKGARKGPYFSDYCIAVRAFSGEQPLTTYCPNDAEWFAEIFRLFVTNPDLLRELRPRAWSRLRADGLVPLFDDRWDARLAGAPARTIAAARAKVIRQLELHVG